MAQVFEIDAVLNNKVAVLKKAFLCQERDSGPDCGCVTKPVSMIVPNDCAFNIPSFCCLL